jgi:hypothetical protein
MNAPVLLRLQALEDVKRSDLIDRHLRRALVGIERLPTMHRQNWDGPRTKNGGTPFIWAAFEPGARNGPIELTRISWRESAVNEIRDPVVHAAGLADNPGRGRAARPSLMTKDLLKC